MHPTALTKPTRIPLIPEETGICSRPFFQLRAQHAPALFGFHHRADGKPRVRSLRDAAACVFLSGRPARTLGRPQRLVDSWLPIAIPDGLACAFGCGVSADAGRALLRGRLAQLCAWLNTRLEEPPEVVEQGPSRLITVFRCVGYNVDFVSRRLSAARICTNGTRQELSHEIDLLWPLATEYWMHWVLEDLRLGANQVQGMLFVTPHQAHWHDAWLASTAYGLMKTDPRFEELRKVALPRAFGLNHDCFTLSLRARHAPQAQGYVPRSTFNVVWRHETSFRRVARENPRLLKLLEFFLHEKRLPLKGDPVAEMRDYFRSRGLGDAVWRYVHRHGSRLFSVVWEMAANNRLDASVNYLRVLDRAGLPGPPQPSLAAAWFRCNAHVQDDKVWLTRTWCLVDSTVIRVVMCEADMRRRQAHFARFVDDVIGIMHWAMDTGLALNTQHEPPRDSRRLHYLRGWSYEHDKEVFT